MLIVCGLAGIASAQTGAGVISGRVTDQGTSAPLVGANVALDGTAFSTSTDRTGEFQLTGVPAGEYEVVVRYLGGRQGTRQAQEPRVRSGSRRAHLDGPIRRSAGHLVRQRRLPVVFSRGLRVVPRHRPGPFTRDVLDVNLSQRLTPHIRVYADFLNLTNAPLRYYIGTTSRPIQEEYYRWWSMFGVKVNF